MATAKKAAAKKTAKKAVRKAAVQKAAPKKVARVAAKPKPVKTVKAKPAAVKKAVKNVRIEAGGLGPLLDPTQILGMEDWQTVRLKFRVDDALEAGLNRWAPHIYSSKGAVVNAALAASMKEPGITGLTGKDRPATSRESKWQTMSTTAGLVRRMHPLFEAWSNLPRFERNGAEFLRRLVARGLEKLGEP